MTGPSASRDAAHATPLPGLVLRIIAAGHTVRQIAAQLALSATSLTV